MKQTPLRAAEESGESGTEGRGKASEGQASAAKGCHPPPVHQVKKLAAALSAVRQLQQLGLSCSSPWPWSAPLLSRSSKSKSSSAISNLALLLHCVKLLSMSLWGHLALSFSQPLATNSPLAQEEAGKEQAAKVSAWTKRICRTAAC